MVDVDYTYRNSDYYTKWYKQGIVPEDKLFAAYNGISNILGTVASIFPSLKSNSDDDDGKGGSGLNGTVQDASQEEFEANQNRVHNESEFLTAYTHCSNRQLPDKKLVDLAQNICQDENATQSVKAKAAHILANNEANSVISRQNTSNIPDNPFGLIQISRDGDATSNNSSANRNDIT